MNEERLLDILTQVKEGALAIDEACDRLKTLPYEDLGFAKLDHHRALRDNFPEVIYCEGKTDEQVATIFKHLALKHGNILGTRARPEVYELVRHIMPDVSYNPLARLLYLQRQPVPVLGQAAVITAGTADIPVAEEAALCLQIMGGEAVKVYDVGVAGLHRLLDKIKVFDQVQVVIVVAGMEGALASVVGGLTRRPVIAVPTSVGYGASFQGLAALLAMLNSCASGVGVVNIDNGYGAAALAISILNAFNG
ncbi:MAG: nickel pincer cofactor biosynthesis protein LarB [Syntrophomonadaceae bacterium]|nr:nickel pincer cofactor biosynthesis protein LarB [Syntrophomonadaceae bacterium]